MNLKRLLGIDTLADRRTGATSGNCPVGCGRPAIGFVVALAGELLSRYLFFVSVVPKNMAASFFRREGA
jgi:hypothetical protein